MSVGSSSAARGLSSCLLGLCFACGEEKKAETSCSLEARPQATAVGFDANSDGVLDVADGAWLLARNFRGGEDPPCLAAVEAYGDAVDDVGTAWASWYALIAGTAVPSLAEGSCAAPEPAAAACGDGLALAVDLPESASGATGSTTTFAAQVSLVSPDLPVEAWSISLAASGCTVTEASLLGTQAADRRDDPPGLREGGLGMAQASTAGGAVSLVVLDPIKGTTVTPAEPIAVLALTLSATVGASCAPCTLTLEDGQTGRGRALSNTVSSGGRSYAPATTGDAVQVCPSDS